MIVMRWLLPVPGPVAGGRCGQVHGASRVRRDDRRPPGSRHQAVPSQHSPDTTSEKFLSSVSSPAILQSAGTEIESLTELMKSFSDQKSCTCRIRFKEMKG